MDKCPGKLGHWLMVAVMFFLGTTLVMAKKGAPDTTPPSVPTGLTLRTVTASTVSFSWLPSTDPTVSGQTTSGLAGYDVFRNGTLIATTTNTSYVDSGLAPATSYSYTVSAFDAAGNYSAQSAALIATTQSAPAISITITAPANDATVSGVITVSGNASASGSIASVQISIDGGPYVAANGTGSWTYLLDTTYLAAGNHKITAKAIDATGNIATTSITIVVSLKAIPSSFFGLGYNADMAVWPTQASPSVPFGSVRLWDSGTRWNQIETASGTYTWATLDGLLSEAYVNGQSVLYTFGGVPHWISSNPKDKNCAEPTPATNGGGTCDPPTDLNKDGSGTDATFISFVTALMQHLQATGETIQYFEMWNEMNNTVFWNGTAQQLVRMAHDARTIIKQYDPLAVVLSPDTCNCNNTNLTAGTRATTNPQDGMDYYLKTSITVNGQTISGASLADGITFHPYLGTPSPEGIVTLITNMQTVMSNDGLATLPLVDTESSWGENKFITGCPSGNASPFSQTCLDNMAAFVARSYILAASNNVSQFYWYQWGNGTWGTLFDPTTGAVIQPGIAYAEVESWLTGSSFAGPCSAAGTIYTCNLTSPGGVAEEIVWNTSGTSSYTPKSGTIYYTSVLGARLSYTGGNVMIGPEPILFQ